jgi:hypothetical protein
MSTDQFWKSKATRSGLGWFVGVAVSGLLGGFVWNLSHTTELEAEFRAHKQRVDFLFDDVREIKSDVKQLLKGNHP